MNRLRIGSKILIVVALLACVTVIAAMFAASRMQTIDQGYSALIDGPAIESVNLARAARLLTQTRGDIYALIAETSADQRAALKDAIDKETAAFHKYMDLAKQARPEDAGKIDALVASSDKVFTDMNAAALLALQNQNAQAVEILGNVRGAMTDQLHKVSAAVDETTDYTNARIVELSTTTARTVTLTLAIALAGLFLGILAALLVARTGITKPIATINDAMQRLAGGDKTVAVPGRDRGDELGEMAATVQVFKDAMIEADRLRAEQDAAKKRSEDERRAAMLDLADRLERGVGSIVSGVSSAATELQSTAQSMSATAEQTSRQASVVAAASSQTTQNVQTVASATDQLSASIGEINDRVIESTRIVRQAVEQSTEANARVKSLAHAAQKIGEVVSLISDIAGQTNLLALNATIEAARAGAAGKGFAVVASEVKALATQTARATDEIGTQIRAIQDATQSSADAIASITQTITRVSEISTAIASAVEEQGMATQEISRNVQQAARGTSEVAATVTGVQQAAEETGGAASDVLSAAAELGRSGVLLRTQVDEFLRTVRAG